jgi:hypothetical protein
MLTPKQQSGIALEKPVSRFFELCGLGSILDRNSFKPSEYPLDNHNIVDMVLEEHALVECTNPKQSTFMEDSVMQKKLDYFPRKDPLHWLVWILIVSFAVFSSHIMDRIEALGIILIDLDCHAERTNRRTIIDRLFHSQLYGLVKNFLKSIERSVANGSLASNVCVSQSVSNTTVNTDTVATNTVMLINNLHQHAEPRQDLDNLTSLNVEAIRRLLDKDPEKG